MSHRAKRFRWLAALLLFGLLVNCGDDGAGTNEDGEPRAPRPAVIEPSYPDPSDRLPLELPGPDLSDREKIAYFISLLGNGDQEEVTWATEMLGRAGDAAVRPLADHLERARRRNQMLAENLLRLFDGHVDGRAALTEILAAAKDRGVRTRMRAATALGYIDRPEVVPVLLDLASEGTPLVTRAALKAIDHLKSTEGARGLRGRYATVLAPEYRPTAIRVIGNNLPKAEAIVFLKTLLREKELPILIPAVLELHRLGVDDGRDILFSRYEAGDLVPFAQTALLQALAEMEDTRVLPILIGYATKAEMARRLTAVAILASYRQPAARAALREVTKDTDGNLRREAWHSLWLSGQKEVLEQLHLLLRGEDPSDRRIAATLLAELGRKESAAHLAGALDHEEERGVAMQMALALGKIGAPETAGSVVRAIARDTEPRPSLAVLANNLSSALLLYEEIDDPARSALAKLAASDNTAHRMNAIRAMMRHGRGPGCRKAILAGLSDKAIGVREFAARAWIRFPGADVAPLVRAYQKETDAARARTIADLATRLANRWGE